MRAHSSLALLLVAIFSLGGGCGSGGDAPPPAPGGSAGPTWEATAFPWPMYGRDQRRTNASPFLGPATYTPTAPTNWQYAATSGRLINMQAVLDDRGVYFGTWGLLRRDENDTPDLWQKSDGHYYGLWQTAQGSPAAQERFLPRQPAPHGTGYLLPGRPKLARDVTWCGADNPYLVSFYNGTIEGTPVIDPDTGVQYVGRGDGKLFAIDPATGATLRSFTTFNPQLPADPDGGGEIIAPPAMGQDGLLYFGTWAAPWPDNPPADPAYETNAIYAVDTDCNLVWRYPSATATLENPFLAAPALSPDGKTLYFATWAGSASTPGRLLAIDLTQPPEAGDAARLKWSLDLVNADRPLTPGIWTRSLAVCADGTILVAGGQAQIGGLAPVVMAVRDDGAQASLAWSPGVVELQGYPSTRGQFTAGLALREEAGRTVRIYASTGHVRGLGATAGGALFVLDAQDGSTLASFDPALETPAGVGGMTGPTLDAGETCFVGIRGEHHFSDPAQFVNGCMVAVRYQPASASFAVQWRCEVDGLLDWAQPVIGATGGLFFGSSARSPVIRGAAWHTLTETPANEDPLFYGLFE